MNMLSLLSVVGLAVVTIWFVWPLLADPFTRRRSLGTVVHDPRGDDLFRAIAKHAGPKHDLYRSHRG